MVRQLFVHNSFDIEELQVILKVRNFLGRNRELGVYRIHQLRNLIEVLNMNQVCQQLKLCQENSVNKDYFYQILELTSYYRSKFGYLLQGQLRALNLGYLDNHFFNKNVYITLLHYAFYPYLQIFVEDLLQIEALKQDLQMFDELGLDLPFKQQSPHPDHRLCQSIVIDKYLQSRALQQDYKLKQLRFI